MLEKLLLQLLDMSITGSIVILVVLLARLILKKTPKVISYALWSVVLLRLLCPFSIEAPISIVPQTQSISDEYTLSEESISFAGAGIAAYQAVGDALNGGIGIQHVPTTNVDSNGNVEYVASDWWEVWVLFGQYIWIAGVAALGIYSVASYWKLKKRLAVQMLLRDNIYIADDIEFPFVVGFLKPKIYLPGTLDEKERAYIIAHEQHHIRRFDHIAKVLAFFALMLHWFNPLVWLAFVLAVRDMEMSCDEAVIHSLGEDIRGDYAESLLSLATGRRIIAGTPLAFGEGDPKDRIKNLAKWRKPVLWITVAAAVLCAALAVCLLTDPAAKNSNAGVTFYYGTLTETDGNGIAIEQADGNVLKFSKADSFSLEAGINVGTYVAVRCNTGAGRSVSKVEVVERICYAALDKAVDAAIKQVNYSKWHEGQFACSDFAVVDKEKQAGKYETLYGLALHQVYTNRNGLLREVSGSHIPVVITFILVDSGEYVLAEYWQPRDGAYYGDDLRAKFGTVPDTQEYIDAQRAACAKLADAHFEYLYQQDLEEIKKELEEIQKEAEKATAPKETTEPIMPAEYELPDGIAGVVTYAKGLEMIDATGYTPQQAAADGCVVIIDGDVAANENIWIQYTVASSRLEAAKVRLAEYAEDGRIKRLYELVYTRHGHVYRLWWDRYGVLGTREVTEKIYRYLFVDGDGDCNGPHYNMFQVWALSNGNWRFRRGVPYNDSTWNDDAVMVFCNLYQRHDYAPIPKDLQCAEIRNQDGTVAVIWDHHKLETLMEILGAAEGYKNWPKTVERGATLILTGADGTKVEAMLMANGTMIEIDGVFYNYDPGWKEIYTIEDVLSLFGLSEMP